MQITSKPWNAALVLMAGVLCACDAGMNPFAAQSATETFVPVTTEEAFRGQVVGREVAYANGATGTYGADGTWAVTGGGEVLGSGTWQWSGDRWCRQGATVEGPVEPECEAVAVSDSSIRFTGEDGTEGTLPFRS